MCVCNTVNHEGYALSALHFLRMCFVVSNIAIINIIMIKNLTVYTKRLNRTCSIILCHYDWKYMFTSCLLHSSKSE